MSDNGHIFRRMIFPNTIVILYENEETIRRMMDEQKDMKIPTELIPKCPKCGKPLTMNLRSDDKFVEVGITKLPSVKSLREEYAGLLEQKRKVYSAYKQVRADMKELYNVRTNVEHLLDIPTGREPGCDTQKSRQ